MIKNMKTYLSEYKEVLFVTALMSVVVGASAYVGYQYGINNAVGSADYLTRSDGKDLIIVYLNNGLTKSLVKPTPTA